MKIGVAEKSAQATRVGADASGFFARKCDDLIFQCRRHGRSLRRKRNGQRFLKFIQTPKFAPRLLTARAQSAIGRGTLRIPIFAWFGNGIFIIADQGEKIFGALGVHQRVRPGEE